MRQYEQHEPWTFCELPTSNPLIKWIQINASMGFQIHEHWKYRRDLHQNDKVKRKKEEICKKRKMDDKIDHKGQYDCSRCKGSGITCLMANAYAHCQFCIGHIHPENCSTSCHVQNAIDHKTKIEFLS
jgi:hypothetical protein